MIPFRRILCPLDFSDYSVKALRYAVGFAKAHEAELIIQHTVPDMFQTLPYMNGGYFPITEGMLVTRAGEELDRVLESSVTSDSAGIERIIDIGEPSENILQTVRNKSVDLIIMGSHGRKGYDPYLVGSVTNRVLHRSKVPVLVVGCPDRNFVNLADVHPVRIKHLMCAIDFERGSDAIQETGVDLAVQCDAEVLFFHVQDRGEGVDWLEEQRVSLDHYLKERAKTAGRLRFRFLTEPGNAVQEIVKAVQRHNIDLVIIGHHTKRPIEETVLGSVAIRIVAEAQCPVLVIRNRRNVGVLDDSS